VYWLGIEFEGRPLTHVSRRDSTLLRAGRSQEVRFDYGDCETGLSQEGCPIPISVIARPYCQVPPELIAESHDSKPVDVRGGVFQDTFGSAVLWTADVSISIQAVDSAMARRIAENLVRINAGGPKTPDEPLGPPKEVTCGSDQNYPWTTPKPP